jgi:hypothetical protein
MIAHVVTSIDFELRWGVQDRLRDDAERYRRNLEGVREVVPALLELFCQRHVGATWAVVGSLLCENWDEWEARRPSTPAFQDPQLSWQPSRRLDPSGRLHFGPDLARQIARTPRQELGSHSFLHSCFLEVGFMRRDALADAEAMVRVFGDRIGGRPRSFVFPRNQVGFVDVLRAHGIEQWRANPGPWYWDAATTTENVGLARAMRLVDSLAPVGSRRNRAHRGEQRSSYLVRVTLPEVAWRLHVRRIAADARRLADGEVLHLWWHPHNLGADPRGGTRRIGELFEAVATACRGECMFVGMAELARRAEVSSSDDQVGA